jgi:prepilin-type N-terminal cleavage/methylation domain-containing protein
MKNFKAGTVTRPTEKLNMRTAIGGQKGFTLVEMVMVIVILGVIGAFTFQFVAQGVQAFKKSSARKDLYDQGRLALERMVRELRDGKEITDCSSNSITFKKAHPAQAADNIEEVKFELVGTDLKRVGDPSGTPQTAILASDVTSFSSGVEGGSGVSVDAVSSGTVIAAATNMTIAHTVSGSDRLMLVGVSMNNDGYETVTGVTWNGTALTLVGTEANDDDARVEIWRLVAPSTGTHNVVVTFSAALEQEAHAGVMTFAGVDQTTPLGTFVSGYIDDTTPATVDIPSAAGELVFGVVASEYEGLTASSGQDERWNLAVSSTYGAGGTAAGAATVTMSWDLSAANHWAIGGVSIKPAASSPDCSGGGGGNIILDNVTDSYNSGTGPFPHQINSGSGNNRLLVVCYGQENESTINSMSYNGAAMTKIHRKAILDGAWNVTEMWYILDDDMPATAGTYDLAMNITGASGPGIVVLSFEGVAQQAPETYNSSQYGVGADHTLTTQLQNVSVGSLVVSVASNGSSGGYDGSVGGAGGAGIRQSEGQPSSAGMGVSTDLASAGGTFNVVEVSSLAPSTTNRATHIVSAFAPVPDSSSASLWTLEITLTDPNDSGNSVTMRTKVYMRNMPPT